MNRNDIEGQVMQIVHNYTSYDDVQARLKELGITYTVQHFQGDNSFPTEHRLQYGNVHGLGPTLDMALSEWIEGLRKNVDTL